MPDIEPHIETIRQDVACPACDYNLRGLVGAVVNCPECGHECDVVQLLTRRWDKPWYHAPRYSTVCLPAGWLLICIAVLPLGLAVIRQRFGGLLFATLFTASLVMGWAFVMDRAWRVFHDPRGWWVPALAHGVLVLLIAGLAGVAVCVVCMLIAFIDSDPWTATGFAVLALVAIACLWAGRLGERFMAGQCIKRYLEHTPAE